MNEAHPNRKWYTLAAMCFALFMIMLDNTVVNVALPSIQKSLHTDQESLEWTINAYVLTFAALILLGGKLGDRFGRKRMFLVGLAIFTLSSAACALATNDHQLIIARAVQGSGGALMNPLSLSIIVTAFPRRQVATAIGIWAGISSLGLALGPLLGGFLVDQVDWSAVFWINVPIGVDRRGSDPLRGRRVEGSDREDARHPRHGARHRRPVRARLRADQDEHAPVDLDLHARLARRRGRAARRLRRLGVARQEPDGAARFFKKRSFDASAIVVAFVGFSLFGIIFFLTLYFQNVRGYSAQGAGALTLPLTCMTMVIAPLAGKLNPKIGPRVLMTTGMLLTSASLFTLSQIGVHTSYAMVIAPAYVAMGIGIAMTMPTTASTAMGSVSPDKAGIASGVVNASRQVGGALGIAILGTVGASVATSKWNTFTTACPASSQPKIARAHRARRRRPVAPDRRHRRPAGAGCRGLSRSSTA